MAIPAAPIAEAGEGRSFPLDSIAGACDASWMAYPGGKSGDGVYQRIISLMPPHEVYIEPFLGGGAIMRHKRAARLSIGIDLELAALTSAMPPADTVDLAMLDRPSPWKAIGSEIARGSEGGRRTPTLTAMGPEEFVTTNFGDHARRSIVAHGDGLEFLEHASPFPPSTLVYCDPPYVLSTLASRGRYRHMMDDRQHRRLLRWAIAAKCMVMISGYWSEMYSETLQGWPVINYQAMTRSGKVATEYLWFNFSEPTELHDPRYIGRDFREREKLRRQQRRWTAKIRAMSPLQRQALLAAIRSADVAGSGVERSPIA